MHLFKFWQWLTRFHTMRNVDPGKDHWMDFYKNRQNNSLWCKLQDRVKNWFAPVSTDPEEAFRERVLRIIIPVLTIFRVALYIFGRTQTALITVDVDFAIVLTLLAVSFFALMQQKILLSGIMILILFSFGDAIGINHNGYSNLSVFSSWVINVLFAALFLPWAGLLPYAIANIIHYIVWTIYQTTIDPTPPSPNIPIALEAETTLIGVTVWSLVLIVSLKYEFDRRLEAMKDLVNNLDSKVQSRTRDLQIAMDVSKKVSTVLDLEELLSQIIKLVLERFDLSHMSIFLYDESHNRLDLAVTNVEGVNDPDTIFFSLEEEQGLIPLAGRTREPVLVNDIRLSTVFLPNPYMPNTQSELVIPMLVGQQLIGVLDLEATQVNRFSDDDLPIMSSLADQLAIAIHNAQLYVAQVKTAAELRELDQLKNKFLASVSHELRTPLNAIINFTQFVTSGLYGPINEKQVDALEKVTDSGRHLLGLINDVLDMSKIEAGRLELMIEEDVQIRDELEAVCEIAGALVQNKPVSLVKEIQPDLPPVPGDRQRIRQILLNLVSNAAKFTEKGCIRLRTWQEDDRVVVSVEDTGPGISDKEWEIIFEPFKQLKHSGKTTGTGLGLPISRRLAEAHGGQLWLESTQGQGSTFFIALPLKVAAL